MINFTDIIQPVEDTVNSFLGKGQNDVQDIQEYCAKAIQSLPNELVNISSFFAYYGRTNIIGSIDTTGVYVVEEQPELQWNCSDICKAICETDIRLAESILLHYVPNYGHAINSDVINNEFSNYAYDLYVISLKRFTCLMSIASLMDISNMVVSVNSFDDLKALLRTYTDGQCFEELFDDVFTISYSSSQSALNTISSLFEKWIIGNGTAAEDQQDFVDSYLYADYVSVSAFSYFFYELAGIDLLNGLKNGLLYFFSWNYNLTKTGLKWVFSKITEVGKSLFSSEIFEISDNLRSYALPEYPATIKKYSITQIMNYLASNNGRLLQQHKYGLLSLVSSAKRMRRFIQVGNAIIELDFNPSLDTFVIKTYVMLSTLNNVLRQGPAGSFAPACYVTNSNIAGPGLYNNDGTIEIVNPASAIIAINNSSISNISLDTDKQILATSIANYINGLYLVCARGFAASSLAANYKILFNDSASFGVSTQSDIYAAYLNMPHTICYANSDTIFNSGAIYMSNEQEESINRILNNISQATNQDFAWAIYGDSFTTVETSALSQYSEFFVFACLCTLLGYNGVDTTFFGSQYAWVDDSWIVSNDQCFNNVLYSTYNILTSSQVATIYRNRWLKIGAVAITLIAAYLGFKAGLFKKGFHLLFRKARIKAQIGSGLQGDVEETINDSNDLLQDIRDLIK